MKIAIFADHHLGYPRFEEDSYVQAEKVVSSASEKADLILCAGDIFDTKVPKLETLKRAVEIFKKAHAPVFAIHGNHERRSRDMVNPVQLLAAGTGIRLLHGESAVFEKDGEKVQLFGMGSVPEEYATEALKKSLEGYKPGEGTFKILMIHQTIKELLPGSDDELSLEYLESLPFDLIINGHIHETIVKLGGRLLIPGSTVITQLKKSETASKGYFLYDTSTRKEEFIELDTRKFSYEELEFKDAGELEVREAIRAKVEEIRKENPGSLISIKLDGSLKEGLSATDIRAGDFPDVYIENRLNMETLGARLEKIRDLRQENLSVRELALKELREKTKGKITLFDSADIFEKLLQGTDETMEYLEKANKKDSK
jgi:DNA repair exonuclease SbcCD nuclease subunit